MVGCRAKQPLISQSVLSSPQAALVAKVSGGFSWVAYPLDPAVAWAPAGFGGR